MKLHAQLHLAHEQLNSHARQLPSTVLIPLLVIRNFPSKIRLTLP